MFRCEWDCIKLTWILRLKCRIDFSVIHLVLSMSISLMAGVLPKYFHSEWSVAQFRLHEGEQYIVAFGHEKNTVAVVGMDGRCIHEIELY